MKSITSKYIITHRKELSNEITKYWNIIKNENIIPKGATRNFDLKQLLNEIQAKADERILLKLYLQCINMGYKKFSELPTTNNYLAIFTLSEKQEQLFHLDLLQNHKKNHLLNFLVTLDSTLFPFQHSFLFLIR